MPDEVIERELGPEWDADLFARLRAAVSKLGGAMEKSLHGMAGSQEVTEYEIQLGEVTLTVTVETYMGIRLRGPRTAVLKLCDKISPSGASDV